MYRYFIGAKNKIVIIYTTVNLYDCCIRYKLFTVRSSSMLVESNVNCLQYWQVICLLNQVWIAYSKFVKFYAYWIRYELLQYYQVVCLLNQLWIVYNIVKFYGCWIKCELFTVLSSYMMVESNVNIYHCCFSKFCIVVFIGVVFPTCYIFFDHCRYLHNAIHYNISITN